MKILIPPSNYYPIHLYNYWINSKLEITTNIFNADDKTIIIPTNYINLMEWRSFYKTYVNIDIPTRIISALFLAERVHSLQKRRNGNNYFYGHVLPVTHYYILKCLVNKQSINENDVIVLILHDCIEDFTDTTTNFYDIARYIKDIFGDDIYNAVKALSKPPKKDYAHLTPELQSTQRFKDYIEKIIQSGTKIINIKCCDRVINLVDDLPLVLEKGHTDFTLEYLDETKEMFTPIDFNTMNIKQDLELLINISSAQMKK